MASRKKKIFIAGQNGFLGRVLAHKLVKKGYHLLPVNNKTDFTKLAKAQKATEGADVVVNLAGIITSRADQFKRPAEIFYTNSLIQLQLLEAAAKNSVKHFISISSSAAYPSSAPSPLKEAWLFRNLHPDIAHGASYYSLSKWLVIPATEAYAREYNLTASIAVFPNLYGPGDKFNHAIPPLVPNLIKRIEAAKKLSSTSLDVGGGPGNQIDLLYVDDAADFIIQLIEKPLPGFSCINAGYGQSVSVEKICKLIRQNVVFKGTIAWADQKKSAPRYLSNHRSRTLYGWQPRTSLDEGVSRTVRWYLNHGQKKKR